MVVGAGVGRRPCRLRARLGGRVQRGHRTGSGQLDLRARLRAQRRAAVVPERQRFCRRWRACDRGPARAPQEPELRRVVEQLALEPKTRRIHLVPGHHEGPSQLALRALRGPCAYQDGRRPVARHLVSRRRGPLAGQRRNRPDGILCRGYPRQLCMGQAGSVRR